MRKLVSFLHVSLDGFTARPRGEIDWILIDNEMFEEARIQTENADTALYGRKTFEIMEAYWPGAGNKPDATKHDIEHSAWYNKVEKVILSNTMKGQQLPNTTIISDNVSGNISALKQKAGKNIIMFGSPSATRTLMKLNLVDDFWVFLDPLLLGDGIRFLGGNSNLVKLKLLSNKTFPSGVVCLHYERN